MFQVIKRLFQSGIGTVNKIELMGSKIAGLGRPVLNPELCDGCGDCVSACPTAAISIVENNNGTKLLTVFHAACISCGECAIVCKDWAFHLSSELSTPSVNRTELQEEFTILLKEPGLEG